MKVDFIVCDHTWASQTLWMSSFWFLHWPAYQTTHWNWSNKQNLNNKNLINDQTNIQFSHPRPRRIRRLGESQSLEFPTGLWVQLAKFWLEIVKHRLTYFYQFSFIVGKPPDLFSWPWPFRQIEGSTFYDNKKHFILYFCVVSTSMLSFV